MSPPWAVPPSWRWSTVNQVGTVRLGRQRSPETVSAAFPTKYLRAGNIGPHGLDLRDVLEMEFDPVERQIYSLRAGDIVLAEASGSAAQVGRAAIWSGELPDCCFQNTVVRFRPHAVVSEYALLVFLYFSLSGAFASAARGVGIQHLGSSPFGQMQFPLPPIAEQSRIAAEASRQLNEISEAKDALKSALQRIAQQDNTILEAAALGGLTESNEIQPITLPAERGFVASPSLFSEKTEEDPQLDMEFADLVGRSLPSGWRWIRVDEAGEVRLGRQPSRELSFRNSQMRKPRIVCLQD